MNIYSYIEYSRLRTVYVIQQIVYKDEEQDRTQDGSLWHTGQHWDWNWGLAV